MNIALLSLEQSSESCNIYNAHAAEKPDISAKNRAVWNFFLLVLQLSVCTCCDDNNYLFSDNTP